MNDITTSHGPDARPAATKAVISYSGGMDSSSLLVELLARGVSRVKAVSFDYGQRHDIELQLAADNIRFLQARGCDVTHHVINLRDVWCDSPSTLHGTANGPIPTDHYTAQTQKSTVISNRNVIFSAIIFTKALDWAVGEGSRVVISAGMHSNDTSIYPDCRRESVEMARELYRISNWDSELIDYTAPFVDCDKGHVLLRGVEAMLRLGFSEADIRAYYGRTHSCYASNDITQCGECGTCRELREAVALASTCYPWLTPATFHLEG